MLDRTIAPPAEIISSPKIQEPITHHFSNGSPVYVINAGDQPVVKLEIRVQSGICNELQPGLSWITAKMLSEGSSKKKATEIAELFEFYGSFIDINPGFDNTSIAIHTPKKFFEDSVSLLAEIIFSPTFPKKEIDILKTNKVQQLRINNEKTNFIASRKTREALFGMKHPYGKSLSESEVEGLLKEDITNYFGSSFYIKPEFFLSGLVSEIELNILKKYFDHGNTGGIKKDKIFVGSEYSKEIFVEKPDSLQSSIRLAWKIPDKSHTDHFKIMVLNEILGGYFSSRLMKNLREDKGYTYGVHSSPVYLEMDSFLLISADVKAEHTSDAIMEIHKEIDILKNSLISDNELETVKNYIAGSFLTSISSPFQLMEKFKAIHSHNLNYSYYEDFFQSLKDVTAIELLDAANGYLNKESLRTIVVGKK
ncbi:MAG: insulinase family protein [Cyclobacteriaceae bacterium]|jgi:zinc protease|nr:insulinase family protein [Cyclobacteriaceae bacterium]